MTTWHKGIVAAAVSAAVLCGAGNGALIDKYTATALISLAPRVPAVLERNRREYSDREYEMFKKTQQVKLKSYTVLIRALRGQRDLSQLLAVRSQLGALMLSGGSRK